MEIHIETERLMLRGFLPEDDQALFAMDAHPTVHRYLGNTPMTSIDQARKVIAGLQQQYQENGIGRWATIEKKTGHFIGWSGLKFIREEENGRSNYYDVGYRLHPDYWNKGYATEATRAALKVGFTTLNLFEIFATVNTDHRASRRVLEKCGLVFVEQVYWQDIKCDVLKITHALWERNTNA